MLSAWRRDEGQVLCYVMWVLYLGTAQGISMGAPKRAGRRWLRIRIDCGSKDTFRALKFIRGQQRPDLGGLSNMMTAECARTVHAMRAA